MGRTPTQATIVSSTTPQWAGHLSDPIYHCSITVAVRGGNDREVMQRLNAINKYIESGRID